MVIGMETTAAAIMITVGTATVTGILAMTAGNIPGRLR